MTSKKPEGESGSEKGFAGGLSADGTRETLEEIWSDLPYRETEPQPKGKGSEEASRLSLVERISHEENAAFGPWDQLEEEQQGADQSEDAGVFRFYNRATAQVVEAIRRARGDELPDLESMARLAGEMAESIESSSRLVLLATDRQQGFSVSSHCVNVAVLALKISIALGRNRKDQAKVGVAGLLHEIGVVRLEDQVLHQGGEASLELRRRPLYSGEILRRLGPRFDWLVQTVEQVYEREDGSGGPKGLTGKEICEEAKILGIADVLEACIHPRPYRGALTGYELFHELTTRENRSFPDSLLKALLNSFSLYPYNEYVILNTGEIGQVVEVNAKNLMRPRVRILYDEQGHRLQETREIDLQETPTQNITKAITPDALPSAG